MFRDVRLRHMRIEQVVRYFSTSAGAAKSQETNEDTVMGDDDAMEVDRSHRHYDNFSERTPAGVKFPCVAKGIETLSRRRQGRLAVSRLPYLEPLGKRREEFYEQRLLLGLPWYCPHSPVMLESGDLEWTFAWDSPVAALVPQELRLSPNCNVSFETLSAETERHIGSEPQLICGCCLLEESRCKACMYAVGFHRCEKTEMPQWKKGTLHDGQMDFQRVLWNLHRRGVPTPALKNKADEFVANGDLSLDMAGTIIRTIENERGKQRLANEADGADTAEGARGRISDRLTLDEMQKELDKRVEMMRAGAAGDGVTDQARVYDYIIGRLECGEYLRLMVQASAGTGKSFLLTTVHRDYRHSKIHAIR